VRDDPLGSDHLPININMYNRKESSQSKDFNPNRPKLSLNRLDKRLFALLVSEHMSLIPFDVEAAQQYEKWYNVIIECSLQAGGSIIDNGTCKKFEPKNRRITLHNYKQIKSKSE